MPACKCTDLIDMQYGRIAGRKATLEELVRQMISLHQAAYHGNACAHEAKYYSFQVQFKSMQYSTPPFLNRRAEKIK